jgi:hypothetical protein
MLTSQASYHICVESHLGLEWSEWFEPFTLSWDGEDKTILTGQRVDQAALYGMLNKLRDLGLPLISVIRVEEP